MSEQRTPPGEASTGQLLTQVTEDISTLVRDELALAKRDLAESGKKAGMGAGLFGGAGVLALYGLGTLITTIILAIAEGLEPWIAAGIVTVVLFVAAGVVALIGRKKISHVGEAPHDRVQSVKADIDTVKHGTEAQR
ncbi:MAG: phage holin family protein [Aeromicrobium sp.]